MIDFVPPVGAARQARTLAEAEAALEEWFGVSVVLTSSGRGALHLAMTALGLKRYEHRIAVSPMTAGCVFDAVTRHGFPIDPAAGSAGDAALVIHQYGFVQNWRPGGVVIDDICHAFQSSGGDGARDWQSEMAVFSLPKFLSLSGMVGGVATPSVQRAAQLHELLHHFPQAAPIPDERAILAHEQGAEARERVYLARLLDPRPIAATCGGIPDAAGLRAIGARRADMVDRLLTTPAARDMPGGWRAMIAAAPPFAFPLFVKADRRARIRGALTAAGVLAGAYRLDIARNSTAPEWRDALLIPCHPWIDAETQTRMIAALA